MLKRHKIEAKEWYIDLHGSKKMCRRFWGTGQCSIDNCPHLHYRSSDYQGSNGYGVFRQDMRLKPGYQIMHERGKRKLANNE